jgi:signal peptidase I
MNKEKFLKLIKSFLKFIGVCIGSYFIASSLFILFFIISLLLSFVWPSLLVISEEMLLETKSLVIGLVILGGTGCSIILFYLSKKFRKIFKFLIISSFFIWITLIPIRVFPFQYFKCGDNGLEPYLKEGQYFLIQKLDKSIKKGDIVVVRHENGSRRMQIVIGLPDDKIELKNGTYFVNGEPLENIVYDLKQLNGIDFKTQDYFTIVPPDHFYGASTFFESAEFTENLLSLDSHIYKNSDVIGKLLFPIPKVHIEKYTEKDSCNGYPPKTCPEGSKYYCPEKGKPLCCLGDVIDGFCIECLSGQGLALARDKVHKMCCDKNLICNGICYSGCNVEEEFICDKDFGGFCCSKGKALAWGANKKDKMCCDKNLICNGICYYSCPSGQKFYCSPLGDGKCHSGDSIFCNNEYWAPCPIGKKFHCPPVGDPYCE